MDRMTDEPHGPGSARALSFRPQWSWSGPISLEPADGHGITAPATARVTWRMRTARFHSVSAGWSRLALFGAKAGAGRPHGCGLRRGEGGKSKVFLRSGARPVHR